MPSLGACTVYPYRISESLRGSGAATRGEGRGVRVPPGIGRRGDGTSIKRHNAADIMRGFLFWVIREVESSSRRPIHARFGDFRQVCFLIRLLQDY